MGLEAGQIIDGKYRVVRLIGEGGMGTVYEGENSRIGRRVAIKVLHAEVAARPDFVERFEREARAAARIGSRHVCDVLDLGDLPGGDRYMVMEYLDGMSLEDFLAERGTLTAVQLAPIAFELLEGLETMHEARVVHRDLKPGNVYLTKTAGGRGVAVKILDFGVAKLMPFEGQSGRMTRTGMMMGTPLYMSPEQAKGARDVDGRTDIYAASVIFYRALTGALPYHADSLNELLFKIVLEDPKPLRELAPEVDEAFAAIVHKGLARDIADRYETARQYQEAIADWGKLHASPALTFALSERGEASSGPNTPITLPERTERSAAPPTPVVWSESSGSKIMSAQRSHPTILTPIESRTGSDALPEMSKKPAEGADTAKAAATPDPESTKQELSTPPASSPFRATLGSPGPPSNAGSSVAVAVEDAASRVDAPSASARTPRSRNAAYAAVGTASVLALAVAVVLSRGSSTTRSPSAAAVTPPPPSPAVSAVPSAAASPSFEARVAATSSAATATATATSVAVDASVLPAPQHQPQQHAQTHSAPPHAIPAPSAAPGPSAAIPKPMASGRVIRTNLD